jgi:hypothetical protein
MDIMYLKSHRTLITVDYASGVQSYFVTFKSEGVSLNPTNPITNLPNCKLGYIFSTSLYVSCTRMHYYDLSQYPTITEWDIQQPNIEVREIYETEEFVAFVGRNVFTFIYLDRTANYFQDDTIDKLFLVGRMYISSSESGLEIGQISIIQPYISCHTTAKVFLGTTPLLFKTTAECNDTYFANYEINKSMLGTIGPDDVCTYTVYRSIFYWEVGEIKTYPFIGAAIGLTCVVLFIVLLFLVKGLQIQNLKNLIEKLATSSHKGYAVPSGKNFMEEEMDDGKGRNLKPSEEKLEENSKEKGKEKEEEHEADKPNTSDIAEKPKDVEMQENLHVI